MRRVTLGANFRLRKMLPRNMDELIQLGTAFPLSQERLKPRY